MTNTSLDTSTGELPDGWRLVALKDVAEVRLGRQRSPKNHSGTQMRPYLRAANVTWAGLDLDDVKEMNFTDEEMSTYVLRPGDILVNEASGSPGEVGKAAVFDGEVAECAFQNTLIRVRPTAVGTDFLHLLLTYNALSGAYLKEARGVGIAHIGKSNLAAWPTAVPSTAEQEQIVEVLEAQLSRLDAALEHVQALRAKAAQLRRSLLHAAFTGALTGHDTSTGELPEGWEIKTLGDLVSDKADIVDGPFGSNLKSAHYTESGARVIRLQNIGFGEFREADAFISLDHYATLEKHNVSQGDLLFSSLGENLPRACLAPDLGGPAIVKADCIRVRLSDSVNSRFVLHSTQRPEANSWANEQMHGMGRPRLGLGKIRGFPVPFPPQAEQERIV